MRELLTCLIPNSQTPIDLKQDLLVPIGNRLECSTNTFFSQLSDVRNQDFRTVECSYDDCVVTRRWKLDITWTVIMAVFEKRKSSKLTLDDTTPLTCTIEAAQNLESHTDYVIRVQRGPNPENSWQINRRYSDFVTLHDGLKVSGMELGLPPKKVFGNMEREFIAERQQALQGYLNRILSHQLLSSCFLVKRFLDPTNYAPNTVEDALQHVSMFFRSEPHWDVVEPLKDIGWRLRKTYFMVRPKSQPKVKQVLAWSYYGPDKQLDYKDLVPIMKLLPTIQHPFIYPVTYVSASDSGGLAIRTFHATGTLKDFICKAKPKAHYLKKYCLPKSYTAFNMMNIKTYGRMILEALKFLHEKGLPYGHLHAGNVMLEGNACRLLDIENTLLGLPFFYRGYLSHFRKINTTEAVDVYSFGHLLYEMTFGAPLNVPSKDDFPHTIPPPIKSVLESILTTEACKTKLPTVDDLLADPLFSDVTFPERDRPQFRIPSKLKEPLKAAKSEVEKRLQEDARVVSSFRRLSKAQAHHNSDEEKRRRKKANLKKRMSEQNIGESTNSTQPAQTNGNHTGNGAVPAAPPAPAQPPPVRTAPAPPPASQGPAPPPVSSTQSPERGALLSSITGFNKGGLKKTETVDRSGPRV